MTRIYRADSMEEFLYYETSNHQNFLAERLQIASDKYEYDEI